MTAFRSLPGPVEQGAGPQGQVPANGSELAARVDSALQSKGYSPLRLLHVVAHEGHVTLRGRVPSYYMKLVAQETAMTIPGVCGLANELDVVSPLS